MKKLWKRTSSPEELASRVIRPLRHAQRKLVKQVNELRFNVPKAGKKLATRMLDKAKQGFVATATQYTAIFGRLDEGKRHAKRSYRQFQMEHGLTREAYMPHTLRTILIIQCCIVIEALLTSGLMISDGKLDVIAGLSYGFSVAAINVATGVIAGFFALRYADWKINAEYQTARDVVIRAVARIAFLGFLAVMAVLHYAAARVRTMGSHTDIFNFSEVSFFAPFSDYYAIAIIVAGVLGGIIAIREGFSGLSDPVPNYSRLRKEAEEGFNTQAETYLDQALEQLDRLYADTREVIEAEDRDVEAEASQFQQDVIDLNEAIGRHNHNIDSAIDDLHIAQARDVKRREYITGKKVKPVTVDYDAFEALRLDEVPLPEIPDSTSDTTNNTAMLIAELDTAFDTAVADIRTAYEQVLNNPNLFIEE